MKHTSAKAVLLTTTLFATVPAYGFDMRAQSSILLKHEAPIITPYVQASSLNTQEHTSTTYAATNAEPIDVTLSTGEHRDAAVTAIKNGLFETAKRHLAILNGTKYAENGAYLSAVIMGQEGLLNESLQLIDANVYNLTDRSLQKKFTELKNDIILAIVNRNLAEGNIYEARRSLNAFVGNNATSGAKKQFNTLYRKVNSTPEKERALLENARIMKVGLLLPLTGENSAIGESLLRSAQLALFDHSPEKVMLFPHDTQSTTEGVANAVQSALRDGADIIIGPLSAAQTKVASPYASSANVPLLSFSSDKDIASRNTLLLGYLPEEQARIMARKAMDKGLKTVAILAPDTPYGHVMHDAFKEESEKLGLTVKRTAFFELSSNDHTKQLRYISRYNETKKMISRMLVQLEKQYEQLGSAMSDADLAKLQQLRTTEPVAAVDFEGLFIPAPASIMPLIGSELAYYDMDSSRVTLLGTAQWNSQDILASRGEYIRGGLFPAPNDSNKAHFTKQYKSVYNTEPHALAPLAYDAVHIISDLYKDTPGNVRAIRDGFSRDRGFNLVSGPAKFTSDGESIRPYSIHEIRRNGFKAHTLAQNIIPPKMPTDLTIQEKPKGSFAVFNPWNW